MEEILDPNDVRIFSGRSNIPIAEKIAQQMGVPLEPTRFSKFSNDNLFVQLGASVRGRIVYIVQSMTPPVSDHLMELLMMLDIAKSAAAREIHAIIPYFSYARSDKKDAPRISITARLVADLLHTAGATHMMTMALHSPQVHGFFSIPADPLTARMALEKLMRQQKLDPKIDVVVSPDMGRAKPAARFAAGLGLPIASADKTRVSDTEVKIGGLIRRQVQGFEHAIVYDDEIATGGSVVELSQVLVASGIQRVTLVCTHGLFLGPAVERIHSVPQIKSIVTTDTVERPLARQPNNLTVLSVSTVFAEAIRQNYMRRSIGALFEGVEA
ncbi:Ribose-phosphate pyrophosphokinase [hydrothermal vent metagenome]|uniref:ribose-phosphate diphosphokinase n=1 Tax=hydrothermal vent metagenome TaxID=652676 RepID=A0A3B0UXT6_9ZZZZ